MCQSKFVLRICGDYSFGINDQLKDHRHTMPFHEELMQKLRGGFGDTTSYFKYLR